MLQISPTTRHPRALRSGAPKGPTISLPIASSSAAPRCNIPFSPPFDAMLSDPRPVRRSRTKPVAFACIAAGIAEGHRRPDRSRPCRILWVSPQAWKFGDLPLGQHTIRILRNPSSLGPTVLVGAVTLG
ncbi:hypothetical protein FMEAI12_2560012 [Parafrankia sp. Ea1.12]|nr:hypothetical protein FMEAI12_2560012 [Parafrankia sp. Ea1.12]